MKKTTMAVLAVLVTVCFSLNAGAETQMLDNRQHEKWGSFILLEDDAANARMVTQSIDDLETTLLIVDNYPSDCEEALFP